MRRAFFTLISLAGLVSPALTTGATVYKWVDENGLVHYSDQPHAGAQKVEVPGAQTYKATEATAAAAPPGMPQPPALASPPAYAGFAIAQPTEDQVLLGIDSLAIIVRTDPALQPGDKVYLMMDGQPLNGGGPTGSRDLATPVARGPHLLQAGGTNTACRPPSPTPHVSLTIREPSG